MKLKSRLHLNSKFRPYVSGILLLISLIILSHQASRLSTFIDFDVDDFVEYWSASILHIQGHNPYDQKMLTSLQNEVGRFRDVPVIMWNPPWTLALILPFGLLEFSLARFVWFLAHVGVVLVCSAWLWKLYGGSKHSLWIAWLLALTFGPILIMLKVGQISGLFLLGVVGFLYLEKMNKDFFAGVLAAFIMIKPHIGLLFIIILVIWAFHRRKWRILLGVATALTVATAIVTVINPSTFYNYYLASKHYPPVDWATPTIGGFLRYYFGVEQFWMQMVPVGFGLLWALYYYHKHHATWNWKDQLPLLCLVSVVTAAYGWIYDQVLLLCAVIQLALWIRFTYKYIFVYILALSYVILNLLVLSLNFPQFWFFWFAPSVLLLYLIARKITKPELLVVNQY